MDEKILPSHGAGKWFPARAEALREAVDGYLKKADSHSAHPLAVIAPHAGYDYSGQGEAFSYKVFAGKDIRRVIILGPSHYSGFRGISVLTGFTGYGTPLGPVAIDMPCVIALLREKNFTYNTEAHSPEHSVENQIPFIQRVLPNASLVCCVVGFMNPNELREAGKTLARQLTDGHTAIAVSTDFTHYGPSFDFTPFKDNIRENIEKLDMGAVKYIAACDPEGFYRYTEETGITLCGRNAVSVMLYALSGRAKGRLLHYYTSSDESRDFSHTVAYASIVMEGENRMELTRDDKAQLLKMARTVLENAVQGKKAPIFNGLPATFSQNCGAFVTLKKNGQLRGCIGSIFPVQPLSATIIEMARASALHDSRFNTVTTSELPEIDVEISVLTPPEEVKGYGDFVVGKHGIVISLNGRQAVFLPQVAPEQGWDRETTLKHLCLKAGLSQDAWREPEMRFKVFEAIVFGEKEEGR
ncbi:MAG: AmmeMemoRadiSam system protein B [Fibrobacterota bacterium]